MRLPLACPLLAAYPATQACALTGNQTSDALVHRLSLNIPSHPSQGQNQFLCHRSSSLKVSIINNIIFRSNIGKLVHTQCGKPLFFCLLEKTITSVLFFLKTGSKKKIYVWTHPSGGWRNEHMYFFLLCVFKILVVPSFLVLAGLSYVFT